MYTISPITVLDDDKELFETHIGLDNEEKTLLLSAWGKTEEESRMCAGSVIKRLNFIFDESDLSDIRKNPLPSGECFKSVNLHYPNGNTLP